MFSLKMQILVNGQQCFAFLTTLCSRLYFNMSKPYSSNNEFILVVLMSLGIFNIQEYVTFLIKGTQMMFAKFDYVGNCSSKKYPYFWHDENIVWQAKPSIIFSNKSRLLKSKLELLKRLVFQPHLFKYCCILKSPYYKMLKCIYLHYLVLKRHIWNF